MKLNPQDANIGTVVGANVRLQGTLKDINEIIVYGTVEGEVISDKSVQIKESAVVKGPVIGENVTIGGKVKGSIEAKEKIEILESGSVNGSVTTKTLIIQAGATFNGKSSMNSKESTTKIKAPSKSESGIKDSDKEKQEKNQESADFELE